MNEDMRNYLWLAILGITIIASVLYAYRIWQNRPGTPQETAREMSQEELQQSINAPNQPVQGDNAEALKFLTAPTPKTSRASTQPKKEVIDSLTAPSE